MPRKKKAASVTKVEPKPKAKSTAKPAAPSSPKSRVTANRAAFRSYVIDLIPSHGGNREEALLAAIADFTDPEIREMVMGGDMEEEVEGMEEESEEETGVEEEEELAEEESEEGDTA